MSPNNTLTAKEAAGAVSILVPLAYLFGRMVGRRKTLWQVKKLNRS